MSDPSASSSSDHDFNELIEDLATPPVKPRSVRQGLPAEYRMRHDAHYVDELAGRPKDSPPDRAPAPPDPISLPAAFGCRRSE